MSWAQSLFPFLPRVISTPEIKRDHEDMEKHRGLQHSSFQNPSDFHRRLNSKNSKRKNYYSSSSLRELIEEDIDKNGWNVNQSDTNGKTILPFFNCKSKYHNPILNSSVRPDPTLQTPMQTEFIESIKTQFFQLGMCIYYFSISK